MNAQPKLILASRNQVDLSTGIPILIAELAEYRKTFPLNSSVFSIGRHPSNDLVIKDRQVSRYHATIAWLKSIDNTQKDESCAYWIIDGKGKEKRSRNGIEINGTKKLLHRLKSGDRIAIGNSTKIIYQSITHPREENSQLNTIYYL